MKTFLFILAAAVLLGIPARAEPAAPVTIAESAGVVKNVSPDEAEKLLKENAKIVVLDVRTPEEFAAGHMAGAQNIDFLEAGFAAKIAQLDPSKTYLLHCAGGGRSSKALSIMEARKFAALYHLHEGFKAWVSAGKTVVK